MKNILLPIYAYLRQYRCGNVTGIFYVDPTPIAVCHNMRIPSNKVFQSVVKRERSLRFGFMDVSCILLSMILEDLSMLLLHPATLMIGILLNV